MNSLFAAVVSFALLLGQTPRMPSRVLLGGPGSSDSITVRDGHIVREEIKTTRIRADDRSSSLEVTWDGWVSTITAADEKASEEWIRTHSLVPRLTIRRGNLYWDGKKVDLGKVNVFAVYEAIPWQSGVLIYGGTRPRRGFFESWPFKGDFIEARDIEPYCAIFFDLNTLKGEDRWLTGKFQQSLFVYPIPH